MVTFDSYQLRSWARPEHLDVVESVKKAMTLGISGRGAANLMTEEVRQWRNVVDSHRLTFDEENQQDVHLYLAREITAQACLALSKGADSEAERTATKEASRNATGAGLDLDLIEDETNMIADMGRWLSRSGKTEKTEAHT
eukprot:1599003-Amphidinium_carterae.1